MAEINIPNVQQPNVNGGSDQFTPLPYIFNAPLSNNLAFSPKPFNANTDLYEIDTIAYQSGFKDWVNSFIQGVNQTQISSSQYKLFNNQRRIAEIEGGTSFRGELQNLDSAHLRKELDELSYLQKRNDLLGELNSLYNENGEINSSILGDQNDILNAPVKKSFQARQQLLQGIGSDAGFLDSLKYTQPSVLGSSAATLGATLLTAFGSNLVKNIATRVVGSAVTGPAAPFVASALTLGTLFTTLYQARKLESEAEVGGAISEDFERLRTEYLKQTGKNELSPEEYNELIVQASKGSDEQYWKNMSLAAVDATQAMLLAGGVGKWFETMSNLNKFTKIGTRLGEFYLESKAESLEEGLQYAFQKDKSYATATPGFESSTNNFVDYLNNTGVGNFINNLRQDYVDVLSSLNVGPIKGNGKYAEDPEFQFSTDAGFIMGALMGGSAVSLRVGNDLYNYKKAVKDLERAGVESSEGNVFKFKTDIYKSYFEPSRGMFGSGILSSDSADRVHYLMEGVKALGNKTDSNGNPILTQEEVRSELSNISQAYRMYDKLSNYLDNVAPSYDRKEQKMYKVAKEYFSDAIFRESMQMVFHNQKLAEAKEAHSAALAESTSPLFNLVNINSQIEAINNRITKIKDLQLGENIRNEKISYLEKRKKDLETVREQELSNAGATPVPPADPGLVVANENLLTAEMHMADTQTKYNNLLKIKSYSQLKSWFEKTATNEALNNATEKEQALRDIQRQEASESLANRKAYDTLTDEEEKLRASENQAILKREGFTQADIDSMTYEQRESTATDILSTRAAGNTYVNPGLYLNILANLRNQSDFDNMFVRPDFQAFLASTLPGITRQTPYGEVSQAARREISNRNRPAQRKERPINSQPSGIIAGRKKDPSDLRTTTDIKSDAGFVNNKAKQSDVLSYINSNPYSSPAEKELARQFLLITKSSDTVTNDETLTTPGMYTVNGNLTVNLTFMGDDYVAANNSFENVILHELIHKYTVSALTDTNSSLVSRFTKLYNHVSDQARKKGQFDKFYGLNSLPEFIAEAMTSPQFQEFLKGITYQNPRTTAWEAFLQLVNQALKAVGINTTQTALDEAIALTTDLIAANARPSFTQIKEDLNNRMANSIKTSNTVDQNIENASNLYQEIYDTAQLTRAEFSNLKDTIDNYLAEINNKIRTSDKNIIKFGEFSFLPGQFIILNDKNVIYTVESRNSDGTVDTTYIFNDKATGTKKLVHKKLSDPKEVAKVFDSKADAIDFIKSKTTPVTASTNKSTVEITPLEGDGFGQALKEFIDYTEGRFSYGTLDPKLLELGNNLIKEAVKLGKNNFMSISQEIVNRVGIDTYKKVFPNLRAVYVALFADTKGLTDAESTMSKLVMGESTADSILRELNPPPQIVNDFTNPSAAEEPIRAVNINDKISGRLLKSTGQQFRTDSEGVWTGQIDDDPVKSRYYKFLSKMNQRAIETGKTMSQLGFKGLLVQDAMTLPDGTPIPHEDNTIEYLRKQKEQGKEPIFGQIVIITDLNQNPLKFNQEGELDENGSLITFNIESIKTAASRDPEVVASVNGLTIDQAKQAIQEAANTVKTIRENAKKGLNTVLDLIPTPGVAAFSNELNSMTPLATQNFEIEIATVRKDDTNVGYFVNHPNNTGLLGGAYLFVKGVPVKIEPNRVSEKTADLVIAILDQQDPSKLDTDELKSRTKFLNELIYQRFQTDPNKKEGSFYFRGKDVYVNGSKVTDRKSAILENGRYNITSYLLNNNWAPYTISNGKVVKSKPVKYNAYLLNRASTKAILTSEGNQVLANAYFNYTVDKQIQRWENKTTNPVTAKPVKQSGVLSKSFKSNSSTGDRPISIQEFLDNLDHDATGIEGIEDFIQGAIELRIIQLAVSPEGERRAQVYIDRGEGPFSGSTALPVVFKSIATPVQASPVEQIKSQPSIKSNEQMPSNIVSAFRTAATGEGGQFKITLVDGTKYGAALSALGYNPKDQTILAYPANTTNPKAEIIDINLIDSVESIANVVIYKKEDNLKKSKPLDKRAQLLEKLKRQNEAIKSTTNRLDEDIEGTMSSLGRPITLQNDTTDSVSQEELDWFSKTFAKSYTGDMARRELILTNQVINSNLWGEFTENGINLYRNAPKGTLYHESFHEFTQIYLTLNDKKDLYNSAKRSIPSLKDKTDLEIEEYLAEEFRKFAINDGNYKITPKVKNIFQRIWNYIKILFFGPVGIDDLFNKLYKGKINNYVPSINNIQFKRLNAGIQNAIGDSLFDSTQSITVVKSIDRLIYDFIHSYNKAIVDVLSTPKILEASYKFAYKAFVDKLVALRDTAISKIENTTTEEELDKIQSDLEKQSEKFDRVINNWNDVIAYHQRHSKTFTIRGNTISFSYDEEGNILEENDDTKLEKPKNAFDSVSGNEVSSIDGANKETRALIRGLGKATSAGPLINEFGIQELVDFGSTWNNLAINLQGTMELSKMFKKLDEMKFAFPEYAELLIKLNADKDKSQLTLNQISQLAKFRQDFSKSYIGIFELVFDPEAKVYKFIEATKNNIQAIDDQFTNNFISYPVDKYIQKDEYGTNYLTGELRSLKIDKIEDRINFLKILGINLSEGTLSSPQLDSVVTGKALSAIKNAAVKLIDNGVKITDPISQLRRPNVDLQLPGEAGNIDNILKLESLYTRNNASASMINAEGNTVYALSLNNLLTISNAYLSDADNYPTYQDVIANAHMKHLDIDNNPYVRHSIWLNEMFILDPEDANFGKRKLQNGKPVVLSIINYNGLSVEQTVGASEGSTTTNLWIGDKLVQDFNALLTAGTKEMMRAGDKASAFAVRINGYSQQTGRENYLPVRIEDFANDFGGLQTINIFDGYLVDELSRIQRARFQDVGSDLDYYNKSSKDFNLFRDILPKSVRDAMLSNLKSDTNIELFVDEYYQEFKDSLRNFFTTKIQEKLDSFKTYQFNIDDLSWIDSSLVRKYSVDQLLRAYVVNSFILNVEQTKIFNGDGAFYKAFHKRNSKDSSTGTTFMTDDWFINWFDNDPNHNLQSKILGVNNPASNITNTVVFSDNVTPSVYLETYRNQLSELGLDKGKIEYIVDKYASNNEGDAQGWITLDFYRTFKLSQGKWFPEHEKIYQKASRGEQLTSDEIFYFMPIKAQYAGPLDYDGAFAPAFHKFSLVPLLPSVIKGTKMEVLNEKMIRNNVGYGLFESGSKVATKLGKAGFYDNYNERTPVNPQEAFSALNPIFNHYLKEQVNIDPVLHDEVIFGTQFRKLLFQNLFNQGNAIEPKWDKLYNEYANVLDQLILNEKQRLLEELGIEETADGHYVNVDFTKLVDKFVKEARRRNMNSNVETFMEYDKDTNSFKYPLDASINRQQIQNMLMSIINNRLVRQHMTGDLMVQVSGSGFEKYERPTNVQLEQYGTNGLRFYHLKDGKTQSMQVKIPLTGEFENLLYFRHNDGEFINSRERLNEMLANSEWLEANRKAVTMLGYRIPTQGLNSIEFMEVAEFLPAESGNILILPTEIVTKAGSDFDIDKLSIFKPSIRVRYTVNKQTKEKEVTDAFYVEPKSRSLKVSIEKQRETLTQEYESDSGPLKDRLNKLKDDKYLDVRFYQELKNQLKAQLNLSTTAEIETLFDLNHQIKRVSLEIAFTKNDLVELQALAKVSELTEDQRKQRARTKDLLDGLYDSYDSLVEQREQQKIVKNTAFQVKNVLLADAERVISNYFDNYYAQVSELYEKLNTLQTEYLNNLEELRTFKAGLQNRVIEIGREVLEDRINFEQLITPNDTGLIKPGITKVGGIKQLNGYPLKTDYTGTAIYTEKTQEEKFLAGLVGKKALGIAAVNNTFTQLFEIIGLRLNDSYIDNNSTLRATNIRLLDKLEKGGFDFSNSYDEAGILKSEFISQMINAYVDVLNDDFIFYANAGLDVAPTIFYLKNAGVKTEKIFYFINHPVIKYFITNTQATKSHILKSINSSYDPQYRRDNDLPSFKNQIYKSLVGLPNAKIEVVRKASVADAANNPNFFTESYLLGQISKPLEKISYEERSAILGHFLELQQQADLLRKYQSSNSYDTKTAATPVDSENFHLLDREVKESKFIDDKYIKAISETVIKPYNVTQIISDVFNSLMPATMSKNIVDFVVAQKADLPSDMQDRYIRTFTNDILLYVFGNYVTLQNITGNPTAFEYVNGNEERNSMFQLTDRVKDGRNVKMDARLSSRIRKFKNDPAFSELRDRFPIINQLRIHQVKGTNGFTNVYIYRGENTTDTQNSLIEQFSRLANFDDPNYTVDQQKLVRKLFKDLALFGFAQSGLNKSPISFTDIIPNELYTPLIAQGLLNFQEDITKRGFKTIISEYNRAFKKNNPEIFGEEVKIPSYRYKDYRTARKAEISDSPKNIKQTVPGIKFSASTVSGYAARTKKNASADATIAIASDFNSAGERLTRKSVIEQGKLYLPVSIPSDLSVAIDDIANQLNALPNKEISLNIAGNGIYTLKGVMTQDVADSFTLELLSAVIRRLNPDKRISSIRTGGQTGFDEAGAKAGVALGIPTEVHAPKNWTFRDIEGTDISDEAQFKARFNIPGPQPGDQLNFFYGGFVTQSLETPPENSILYSKYSTEFQTELSNIQANIDNIIDKLGLIQRCD